MPLQSPHLVAVGLLYGTSAFQAARMHALPGPMGLDLISSLLIVAIVLTAGFIAERFIYSRKRSGAAGPLALAIWTPLLVVFLVVLVWYLFDALQSGQIHNLIPERRFVSRTMKHFWLSSNPVKFWISVATLAFLVWIVEGGVIRCLKATHRLWKH